MNKPFSLLILAIFLLIPILIGVTAGFATSSSVSSWYVELNKPFFNPPNWLFGPVWTVLYLLMGISSWLVYRSPAGASRTLSLDIYGFMLFLNFIWSFLFFGFRLPGAAFVEIILLWLIIVIMIIQFYRVHRLAALLQIPYLLWISFASLLNGSIWYLN
jgi:translocator protein